VWRVLHEPVFTGGYRMTLPAAGRLLMVLDYADRWPVSHLRSLLTHLKSMNLHTGLIVRVLLLARSTTAWWPALRNRLRSDHQVEATTQPLPPLGERIDRGLLYRQASDRFATAMDVVGTDEVPPPSNLSDDAFRQVLSVHMAALVAVDAHRRGTVAPIHPHALSSYLLERERDHWYALHNRPAEPRKTPPEVMGRAVYLATLTAAVPRATATDLLHRVGLTEPGATTIIDDHRFCYPPDDHHTVLQALYPDRLGEDLIALSTPGHPHTDDEDGWDSDDWAITAAEQLLRFDTDPPPWATRAVTMLVETARRWDHVATDVLYPLLRQHPHLALAAGGTTITRLATIPDIDPDVLAAVDDILPPDRHIDLDIAAAAITTALTPNRLAATTDPAEHAHLHTTHALRLANAGLRDQALPPAQEAVTICRRLAGQNPDAYLPDLAMSLNNLGGFLSEVGRRDEALTAAEEAVTICRRLAGQNPDAHLPHLAMSLNNLGASLSEMECREEALTTAEEASAIYRKLTEANPAAYLPDLAMSLTNHGNRLSAVGRRDEALPPAEEATAIYRKLAQSNSDAYLPALALSLTNLGIRLSEMDCRDEALTTAEEATAIYRKLTEANPAAYLPDLAMSLNNLGAFLSAVGRAEALITAEEAVAIRRRLAQSNSDAYLPALALSLTNLGIRLSAAGRRDEALATAEEAVAIHRGLARQNAAAHLPDLASSLNNLGVLLSTVGRRDEALTLAEETTDLYRQLATANHAAHLPDLAGSLSNLGSRLFEAGRQDEALAVAGEATDLFRRLATANPAAHLSNLAMALLNLGALLSEAGRPDEALALVEEAAGLYRRLAETNPAAYLPNLARSLLAYAWVCANAAVSLPAALDSVNEAIDLYESLTEGPPQMFADQLYAAYQTLADVLEGLGRTDEAAELRRQLGQDPDDPPL
jgi:tetratricopeptide (TPR) repeat protein